MNLSDEKLQNITAEMIAWIREMMRTNGGSKAVIGISGGKDSSVAAALCKEAVGGENVLGVLMPNGNQVDIDYAHSHTLHPDHPLFPLSPDSVLNASLNKNKEYGWSSYLYYRKILFLCGALLQEQESSPRNLPNSLVPYIADEPSYSTPILQSPFSITRSSSAVSRSVGTSSNFSVVRSLTSWLRCASI